MIILMDYFNDYFYGLFLWIIFMDYF